MLASLQTICLYLHKLPISFYPRYISTLAPPPSLRSITIITQIFDENTTSALDQLPALVLSLHAFRTRSLEVHGNLQKIQLFVLVKKGIPSHNCAELLRQAKRYLIWPDRETEGVFEVYWRQREGQVDF